MNLAAEGPAEPGARSRGEPRAEGAGDGKADCDHGVENDPEGVPLVGPEDKPEGESGMRRHEARLATGTATASGTATTSASGTEAGTATGIVTGTEVGTEVEVVVARYREDTAWTRTLGLPCLVYDKSGETGRPGAADRPGRAALNNAADRLGPAPLPNVGRETHTYLTHIVRHYEALAQHTVFVQADPFDHMGPGADPASFRERILQNVRLGVKFTGFAWYKLKCDRLGRPHALADPHKAGKWPGHGKDIPVGEVYEALFRGPAPETFLTQAPAGLLFVARQRILARPQPFYRKALALVEADPEDARNTGHAFERLWPVIFNGNQDLNKDRY